MSTRNKVYIVDGTYHIFRAYYALRGLTNSKGFPTNALYGFVGMLKKLVEDEKPPYLLMTFDPRGDVFRNEIYPEYKANRSAPPDDLVPQFPLFRDIVRGFNIPVLELPGFEADDVMGTLALQAVDKGFDVVLVTGDKDMMQLVGPNVSMLDTMRDRRVGVDEVHEKFQAGPSQVPDVLGLMGDSSDNIPGVPGVGPKTAGKLIDKYGSIEGVYDHIDEMKGKLKERLVDNKEQAFLSRVLATIKTDVDVVFEPEAAESCDPDVVELSKLFRHLEFNRHLADLESRYGAPPEEEVVADSDESPESDKHYKTIASVAELESVVASIRKAGRLAIVVQSNRADAVRAVLVGLGLAWQPNKAVYVPVGHRDATAEQLPLETVLEALAPVLEDANLAKIGHNTKADWLVLNRQGVELNGVRFDTMLASYILDPSQRSHGLEVLAHQFLGVETTKYGDIAGRGAKQKTFDFIELETAAPYSAEDAEVVLGLRDAMRPLLEDDEDLCRLHDELELPLSGVLARMERHGVLVDPAHLDALSDEFAKRAAQIEEEIFELADRRFNINSPKQLADVLFNRLKLPVVKKTKTGPSTDHSVLERLSSQHALPELVLSYRSLTKLKNTYTDALSDLIDESTGRIHTEYRQDIAATGRLSSNNPNLQNIPVRTQEGRRIREAFVAPDGMVLLSADYSQVELRLLAHMSGDPVLLDAFRQGQDIHARTAAELFDVEPDQVEKGQRSVAKTINFGVLYGMGVVRLSRELNISRKEATEFIERYRQRIAGVRDFLDALVERATVEGYARTLLGRRRPLPELRSKNHGQRALGERLAVNTPIQGTAADLIKLAMVNVQRRLDNSDLNAAMLLQVHDELVFEVDSDQVEALRMLVVEEMEGAMSLSVPLSVDVSVGSNWAEL